MLLPINHMSEQCWYSNPAGTSDPLEGPTRASIQAIGTFSSSLGKKIPRLATPADSLLPFYFTGCYDYWACTLGKSEGGLISLKPMRINLTSI